MPMYRLFYLWHNHKLFLYYILTIYIPSTFIHIMFMYMYYMNQFEINHSFKFSWILVEISLPNPVEKFMFFFVRANIQNDGPIRIFSIYLWVHWRAGILQCIKIIRAILSVQVGCIAKGCTLRVLGCDNALNKSKWRPMWAIATT